MKFGKLKIVGAVTATTVLAFSATAMAYVPGDYCGRLSDNWTGSAGNWLDWIAMCI